MGQAAVSWVALGVTLVLPSLLFKLAAQKEKWGVHSIGQWALAGKSAQHGGKWRLWGAIYGAHWGCTQDFPSYPEGAPIPWGVDMVEGAHHFGKV